MIHLCGSRVHEWCRLYYAHDGLVTCSGGTHSAPRRTAVVEMVRERVGLVGSFFRASAFVAYTRRDRLSATLSAHDPTLTGHAHLSQLNATAPETGE